MKNSLTIMNNNNLLFELRRYIKHLSFDEIKFVMDNYVSFKTKHDHGTAEHRLIIQFKDAHFRYAILNCTPVPNDFGDVRIITFNDSWDRHYDFKSFHNAYQKCKHG